jgi:enediyne biosynthesis protein E5
MSNGIHQSLKKPPLKPGKVLGIDKRFLAPILITLILAVGEFGFRILESYWATATAILTAILAEIVLARIATGKWPHLASAYITGISVGIILRSTHVWRFSWPVEWSFAWPYALCSLLATSSKYALRVKDRHLFNPSNLGISVLLFLLPEVVYPLGQQWGNEPYPILLIFSLGAVILFTLGRLHITLTYVIAFSVLALVRSGVSGTKLKEELYLITSPAYMLFMFFMITDPKSTTRTKFRQCVVAVVVAVVETTLRLCREVHAPYYALFLTAPATNLLEIAWDTYFARKPSLIPKELQIPASPDPLNTGITTPQETAITAHPGVPR